MDRDLAATSPAIQRFTFTPDTPFKKEEWFADGRIILSKLTEGHFNLFGFRVKGSPQFEDTDIGRSRAAECLMLQKIALDGLQSALYGCDATIELRFTNGFSLNRVDCVLLCSVFTPGNDTPPDRSIVEQIIISVCNSLPSNYRWAALNDEEWRSIGPLSSAFHIAEVRKIISWLPVGNINRSPDASIYMPVPRQPWANTSRRERPPSSPALDYIRFHDAPWRNTFGGIKVSSTTVTLRISLHPTEAFDCEQQVAKYHTELINQSNKSRSEGRYESLVASLSKYMPTTSIYSFQAQVASTDPTVAKNVAHAFAAEVCARGQRQMSVFFRHSEEVRKTTLPLDWKLCRQTFPKELEEFKQDGFEPNDSVRGFLLRAPHLLDKSEVTNVFRLPVAGPEGLPGIPTFRPEVTHAPKVSPDPPTFQTSDATNEIFLGRVVSDERGNQQPFKIKINDLVMNAGIFGVVNSGKSHTTRVILYDLYKQGIPWLLVEPAKPQHFATLQPHIDGLLGLHIRDPYFLEEDGSKGVYDPWYLRINPLQPITGTTIQRHIGLVYSCLCAVWPLWLSLPMVLKKGLNRLYKEHYEGKLKDERGYLRHVATNDEEWPNLETLWEVLQKEIAARKDIEIQPVLYDQFESRFLSLFEGEMADALIPTYWEDKYGIFTPHITVTPNPGVKISLSPIEAMLSYPTVLDVSNLSEEDGSLVMALIFMNLYEKRLVDGAQTSGERLLKHCFILEESHRLLANSNFSSPSNNTQGNTTEDSKALAIRFFTNAIVELSGYGQSIITVDQTPTKLAPDAVKHANLRIMHRLTALDDRNFLGSCMNLTPEQIQRAVTLGKGQAVVFTEGMHEPLLVQVRYPLENLR